MHIRLPLSDGLTEYKLNEAGPLPVVPGSPSSSRVAYAAAHVVVDPFASRQTVDMDATLEFRRYLWSLGFGEGDSYGQPRAGEVREGAGGLSPGLWTAAVAVVAACDSALAGRGFRSSVEGVLGRW